MVSLYVFSLILGGGFLAMSVLGDLLGGHGDVDADIGGFDGDLELEAGGLDFDGGGLDMDAGHLDVDSVHADLDADAGEPLLAAPLGHPEAFVAPESPDTLVVDPPTGSAGHLRCATPTPPGPVGGELAEPGAQLGFVVADRRRRKSHRGAVDANHVAGPAL